METTKSEIVRIITAIKIQCPEALPYKDRVEFEILVNMWHEMLGCYPKEVVWQATKNAMKKTVYQKQNWIGAICQEIEKFKEVNEKTDGELWTELTAILNKVGRTMYFGGQSYWDNGELIDPIVKIKEFYEELDPILKGYVGGISGLISLTEIENLEYEKGRFLKSVENLRNKQKQKAEMSPEFEKLVNGISIGIENKNQLRLEGSKL